MDESRFQQERLDAAQATAGSRGATALLSSPSSLGPP